MRNTIGAILLILMALLAVGIAAPVSAKEVSADFVREEFPPVMVYQNIKDSLVSIESVSLPYAGVSVLNTFQRTITRTGGTGFLVTSDGYILSYPQTVEDSEIVTVTIEGEEYRATVETEDEYYQITLLKVWWPEPGDPLFEDYPAKREFKPITWGDSTTVKRGDPVMVLGDPVGLDDTMTYGYCSNIRDMRMIGPNGWDGILVLNAIVIDASINPGNYGGPVLNNNGEVIGVVNRKSTGGVQNINYCLPSNKIMDVVNQLIENGKVFHPWFGVFPYASYDKKLAVYIGIPIDEINPDTGEPYELVGVLIEDIAQTSPAAKIGMQMGDLILRLDGDLIEDIKDLEEKILSMQPDSIFKLTIIRNNEIFYKQVRIMDKEPFYANISGRVSI
jgi:serine protease Do